MAALPAVAKARSYAPPDGQEHELMCGIAGGWSDDPRIASALHEALARIRHRGPDGQGSLRDGPVFLGMRRLAIIDIAGGDQPVYGEGERLAVVFNGEIYNYRELRRDLAAHHEFHTESDTETLVHLSEDAGPAMCSSLRGMFAFAIWDSSARSLFIARDRFGKKPLYYQRTADGGLIFASELKALRELARAAGLQWRIREQSLYDFLSFGYIAQPDTIYEDVHALPPGAWMRFDGTIMTIEPYWKLDYGEKISVRYPEILERVRELVGKAVELRLRADVPLGVFLSGGIDSSVVAYEAAKRVGANLRTFTVAMPDAAFDESAVAVRTARAFGVENTVLPLVVDPLRELQRLVDSYDQPYGDSSAIPTMAISRLAREHVTVILTGDGGDEIFAGYRRYVAARLLDSIVAAPFLSIGRMVGGRATKRRSAAGFIRRLVRMAGASAGARYLIATSDMLLEPEKLRIWRGSRCRPTEELIEERLPRGGTALDRQLAGDVQFNLLSDLLVKMDIATMAASLEARSPLLDHHIAELTAALPVSDRLHHGRLKALLKDAYRTRVPDEVLHGPKRGFEVPLSRWLAEDFRETVLDLLGSRAARIRDFVDGAWIDALIAGNGTADKNASYVTFSLLVAEMWLLNNT